MSDHRGASCNVDITPQWSPWLLMPLTLEEARARIALLPRLPGRACREGGGRPPAARFANGRDARIERYAATGTAIPSCSHVGATSDTVARCMSRGQRKSS